MSLKDEPRRNEQIDCYTEERRLALSSMYNIKLYFHSEFLKGIDRLGAAGKVIGGEYYIFLISDQFKNSENFTVGAGAGKNFMMLTGETFNESNSFHILSHDSPIGNFTNKTNEYQKQKTNWNPAMKQLNDAVNLCIALFVKKEVDGAFKDVKEKTEKYKWHNPFPKDIKSINTALETYLKGYTLQEYLSELRINNRLRKFKFDLISQIFFEKYGEFARFE